jgi:hypothetical protein
MEGVLPNDFNIEALVLFEGAGPLVSDHDDALLVDCALETSSVDDVLAV